MSEPIQPKVKMFEKWLIESPAPSDGTPEFLQAVRKMLNSHAKLLSDLSNEVAQLREEVEKLKNPEVTIHTPRFGGGPLMGMPQADINAEGGTIKGTISPPKHASIACGCTYCATCQKHP